MPNNLAFLFCLPTTLCLRQLQSVGQDRIVHKGSSRLQRQAATLPGERDTLCTSQGQEKDKKFE